MLTETRRQIRSVLVWLPVVALTPAMPVRAERLPIRAYTTADGLAHETVNRIVPDSRGFLWFCTADGLSRFDGYAFTNFRSEEGLPPGAANDLLETRAGEYWVATDGGLVLFNPKGRPQRGVVYESEAPAERPMFTVVVPGDPDRRARAITVLREDREGTIWVGTGKGLYRLENGGGRRTLRPADIPLARDFPAQRQIVDILEDSHGSVWIATYMGLYRRWPDGSIAQYATQPGLPKDELTHLFEDRRGRLWVATRAGLFALTIDAGHDPPSVVQSFGVTAGLPSPWVVGVFETSAGRFWVATANGLAEFVPRAGGSGGRFRSYSVRNGLSHRYISALAEDVAGNLWIATTNAGVMKMARDGFTAYGVQDGIDAVGAIFEDRAGNLCLRGGVLGDTRMSVFEGGRLGLLDRTPPWVHLRVGFFDGFRFGWFFPAAVPDLGWVTQGVTLQAREGGWWFGSGQGLFRFPSSDRFAALAAARPVAVYTTRDGLAASQVAALFEDSRGDVWIATIALDTNGLARWDKRTGRILDLADSPGLPSIKDELPRSFGEDASGNVWIGFKGRVARYSKRRFSVFALDEGVPPGAITSIYLDRAHRLWLASAQSGLVRVDDPASAQPAFARYSTTDNDIEAITEDRDGYLYVGGGHGIDRLDPATGRVKHFTAADGLIPGLVRAAYRDREGVLWFGLTTGMVRLVPPPKRVVAPPAVLITGLRITGVPRLVSALGEQEMTVPDLPARENQLQIDFLAIAFGPGEVLRYQYRLDGADVDWGPLTELRTVTYADLAPGRYTFAVRAVNSDGLLSERPGTIAFRVLRPVWMRWWFLTLTAVGAGFVVHAVYRSRVARIMEMAEIRTRIATDLHDDIGTNLTRIVLLSEVAQRRGTIDHPLEQSAWDPAGMPRVNGSLASIARIARESVSSMSDIVWAITPARDTLLDLTRRMRRHAEDLFTQRDVDLQFDAPDANDDRPLGGDVRRDLLLIFKEAVNNAARHSGCSRVEVDLRIEGARLVLVVIDNGAGFDRSVESAGLGLSSLARRARRLKGTLEIVTSPGSGTTIRLGVPV